MLIEFDLLLNFATTQLLTEIDGLRLIGYRQNGGGEGSHAYRAQGPKASVDRFAKSRGSDFAYTVIEE